MPLVMLSHAPHIRTAVALRKKRRTYLSADGCCYVNQSFLVRCPKERAYAKKHSSGQDERVPVQLPRI